MGEPHLSGLPSLTCLIAAGPIAIEWSIAESDNVQGGAGMQDTFALVAVSPIHQIRLVSSIIPLSTSLAPARATTPRVRSQLAPSPTPSRPAASHPTTDSTLDGEPTDLCPTLVICSGELVKQVRSHLSFLNVAKLF